MRLSFRKEVRFTWRELFTPLTRIERLKLHLGIYLSVVLALFYSQDHTGKALLANENQFKLKTLYIATRGVQEYRQTIEKWVTSDDNILEIGCEWGTTSLLLFERCRNLVATDISMDCIQRAKEKYPEIQFAVLDAFNIREAMALGKKFTKIYIDMSGLSGYRALLDGIALLNMYAAVFEPTAIIIKSGALKQFARYCIPWKAANPYK